MNKRQKKKRAKMDAAAFKTALPIVLERLLLRLREMPPRFPVEYHLVPIADDPA